MRIFKFICNLLNSKNSNSEIEVMLGTLLKDVHLGLITPPDAGKLSMVKGSYEYYHYLCDGIDDRGWGCGYRTLQTLCSWMLDEKKQNVKVPSLLEIQECLVEIGDKTPDFVHSQQWIGSIEVAYCIDKLFDVQCRILHIRSLEELKTNLGHLHNHFNNYGSPIMMGGDKDCSSKAVLGVISGDQNYLLILDPHNTNINVSKQQLQAEEWVQWRTIDSFVDTSFYNFCCPNLAAIS